MSATNTNTNISEDGFQVVSYKKPSNKAKSARAPRQKQGANPRQGANLRQGASPKPWGQSRADWAIQGNLPGWFKGPEWDRRTTTKAPAKSVTDTKVTVIKK